MAKNTNHAAQPVPARSTEVRDALAWSKYLNTALHRFAGRADVLLAQHHWPTWGTENVRTLAYRSSATCTGCCTTRRCA